MYSVTQCKLRTVKMESIGWKTTSVIFNIANDIRKILFLFVRIVPNELFI